MFCALLGQDIRWSLQDHWSSGFHREVMKNNNIKYTVIFCLNVLIFFLISAQNIDCEYSLEPPY